MWPTNPELQHAPIRRTAVGFILAGVILFVMAYFGAVPAAWLAARLSSDGDLTPAFVEQMARSQLTLGLLLAILGASAPVVAPLLLRMARWFFGLPTWPVSWGCGLVAGVGALAVNLGWYDGIPHVTDEISHLFQTKILLSGAWAAPAPPCPMSFHQPHIIITAGGLWHTIYPPGHPILLLLFSKLGLLSVVGPVCLGVAVMACHRLALRFWEQPVAHGTAALLALSPQWLLLGGSWMSHMSFTALNAGGWALWLAARDRPTSGGWHLLSAVAGLLLAWSAVIRPQDFVLTSAIAAAALLLHPRQIGPLLRQLPGLAAGALPVVLVTGLWNQALYGAPWAMGYGHSPSLTPQTQPTYGFTEAFGWREATSITLWSLIRFNKSLLGWPASLLFIPFLVLLRPHVRRRDLVCLGGAGLIVLFFFFYFYYGIEYEARFYCSAVPLLVVATVRGIQALSQRGVPPSLLALAVAAFVLHALFFYAPAYLAPRYGGDYEQSSPIIEETARTEGLQNALVLVPSGEDAQFRYSGAFQWNDPHLRRPVIYARDLPAYNDCLLAAFPERTFHRFVPDKDWRAGRFVPVDTRP